MLALAANSTPRSLVRRINTVLIDIALFDPATVPSSLKEGDRPRLEFSSLCIVQRTLEASIGTEHTRTLAQDNAFCEAIAKGNIWAINDAIKAAREADPSRREQAAQPRAAVVGDVLGERSMPLTNQPALQDNQSMRGWREIFTALYEVKFLWWEQQDDDGKHIAGTSMLTSAEGKRWLLNHRERRAVMQLTSARPEQELVASLVSEPVAAFAGSKATVPRAISGVLDSANVRYEHQRAMIEREIREQLQLPADAVLSPLLVSEVETLSFFCTELDDLGAAILADPATGLTGVTSLDLSESNVTDRGLKELARSDTGLSSLEELLLIETTVTDSGLDYLCHPNTGLSKLTSLDISDTKISNRGIEALADPETGLKSLSMLSLWGTKVTTKGVKAIAAPGTGLRLLKYLDLSQNRITDAALEALSDPMCPISSLNTLCVRGTSVTDQGLAALASRYSSRVALTTLEIGDGKITDQGIAALVAKDSRLTALKELDISGSNITDQALATLATKDSPLTAITTLNLFNTRITDKGLACIAAEDSPLRALTTLHLAYTNVTDQGVAALIRRFPNIEIYR